MVVTYVQDKVQTAPEVLFPVKEIRDEHTDKTDWKAEH